jgi:hypothetical protein
MRKEHKSPSGGLTEAGRKHFERKEGGNLKAPVESGVSILAGSLLPHALLAWMRR